MRSLGLVAAAVLLAGCGGRQASSSANATPAATAKVEKGALSASVSEDGILTFGSAYTVINRAGGIYTQLPAGGDKVGCGGVLYRVDDRPVVLLCGKVPAYRGLHAGDAGPDVRQLNGNLRVPGRVFTAKTEQALKGLQRRIGQRVTGAMALGDVVFLLEPVRVAKVTGTLGAGAQPGAPVLTATSDRLEVQVALDPSQQGEVKKGDRAQITLPGNTVVSGKVERFGSYSHKSIPTFVSVGDVAKLRGLEQAPVSVDITTKGVEDALSVPVTAIVGKAGGGFAVEVVRAGGRRAFVAVRLGLFDTGGGRVQVSGAVRAGDRVVVPSL